MSVLNAFRMDGQVAIVTGAGAGNGKAIARIFAGAGAAVVVGDRDGDRAVAAAHEMRDSGAKAIGVACDVTREADLAAIVAAALAAFAEITVLVNGAGGGGPRPFDMPMAEFVHAYELNVFSAFRLCQLCAPEIEVAGGGAILNMSSMAAVNRGARMAAYASSKAAVDHLTRNLACDLGPRHIRVNAIAPGAIRTAALARVLTADVERAMIGRTPMHRLGESADIAYAALFLCSPAAPWISGEVLAVNGGGMQELD